MSDRIVHRRAVVAQFIIIHRKAVVAQFIGLALQRYSLPGSLYTYFAADHKRLDELLTLAALTEPIGPKFFSEFRKGILRHIWQEEKILLPTVNKLQVGIPFKHAARLRLDHGAITALLVPPPSAQIVTTIRTILAAHNPLEENPDGLYDVCETLAADHLAEVMKAVMDAPEIPTTPYNEDPSALEYAKKVVERAGYGFAE